MKKISLFKKISLSFILVFLFFLIFSFQANAVPVKSYLGAKTFAELVKGIIEWVADIAVYASVVMGLVASFWFITSGGKPESITKGRDALKWTVIGLIVVIVANPILDIIKAQVGTDIKTTLEKVVGYLQTIGGPLAIVSYLWGSVLYTTGIKKRIEAAHKIFLWTSIGVAVILVASSIEAFVRYFIS